MLDRALAAFVGQLRVDLQFEQARSQRRAAAAAQAGQVQGVAAFGVDGVHVGAAGQQVERGRVATGGGIQQRRAPDGVAGVGVRLRLEQRGHDLDVAGERGLVQRAAAAGVAGVDAGLVPEQQGDAGGIVVIAAGRGQ